MTNRLPVFLLPLALVAGCGEEPVAEPTDNDGRTAAGEVIGGTISDAMLPLDTVRSQGPSMAEESETGSGEPAGSAAAPATGVQADQAAPASTTDEPEPEDEADDDAA